MLELVTLITATGAAARLTRLATTDVLLDRPRTALLSRIAQPKHLRTQAQQGHDIPPPTPLRNTLLTLFTCHWCLGFWISSATITLAVLYGHHPAYQLPALALAVSYATGWLADQERD